MAEEIDAPDKRDSSLPIWDDAYEWWSEAARSKLKPRVPNGIDQKALAAKLGFSESEVSRALSRKKPLYRVVVAISDELEIPRPVLLPKSEAEARYLAVQRQMFLDSAQAKLNRTDDRIAQIGGSLTESIVVEPVVVDKAKRQKRRRVRADKR